MILCEVEAGQAASAPRPVLLLEAGEGPEGRLEAAVVRDVLAEGLQPVDVLPGVRGQVAVLRLDALDPLLVGEQRVVTPPVPHVASTVVLPTLQKYLNKQKIF